MPLNENDLSLLIDIVDCAMDIDAFTKDIGFHEFEKDRMRRLAVERGNWKLLGKPQIRLLKKRKPS
jgi:uncharacterized protein with HEPN domain